MGKIRKSDHSTKIARKKEQMLQKILKSVDKKRKQNQCDCLHTGDNGYDLRIISTKEEVIFECKNCRKRIYGNRLQEAQVNQSIKAIDMMCDTIKMNLTISKPKDVRAANWISELQYHDLYHLKYMYAATQNRNKEKSQPKASMYGKAYVRR